MNIDQFERNCTLVAVREVTRLPDDVILAEFFKEGYKANKGVSSRIYRKVVTNLGFRVKNVDQLSEQRRKNISNEKIVKVERWYGPIYQSRGKRYTLKQFLEDYPEGTFIVWDNGHAWTIRDGISIDPNMKKSGLTRGIIGAFQIIDAPEVKPTGRVIFQSYPANARRMFWKGKMNPLYEIYQAAWEVSKGNPIEISALPKEYTSDMLASDIKKSNVIWEMVT